MQETSQASTPTVTTEPQRMSVEQVKLLIGDFNRELNRVQLSLKSTNFKVSRLNDLTERVKFLRRPVPKIMRALRRLKDARDDVETLLSRQNNLTTQVEHLQNQLTSAGF